MAEVKNTLNPQTLMLMKSSFGPDGGRDPNRTLVPYVQRSTEGATFETEGVQGRVVATSLPSHNCAFQEVNGRHPMVRTLSGDRSYYVIEGHGTFNIDGMNYGVNAGDTVQIKPGTTYNFEGGMTLFLVCVPPYTPESEVSAE